MATLLTLSFLLGGLFGLRFKVFVLVPLTAALALIAILVALLGQSTALVSFANYACCMIVLQIGYFLGSVVGFRLAAARLARAFTRPLAAASGPERQREPAL